MLNNKKNFKNFKENKSDNNINLLGDIADFSSDSKTVENKKNLPSGDNMLNDLNLVFSGLNSNPSLIQTNNISNPINLLDLSQNNNNFLPQINLNDENKNANKLEDIMDLLNINNNLLNTNDFNMNNQNNINLNVYEQNKKFHEIFKNEEISICFCLNKSQDNSVNSTFCMSNLRNKSLINVKINFMVQKFVNLKVLSTSGNSLEAMQVNGIKKVSLFY